VAELKTLSKNDPDFLPYLLGTFSKKLRALPVQSLNVTTEAETVTFQILNKDEIMTPNFLKKWAQILKLNNFILVFLPVFLVLAKCTLDDIAYDPLLALFSGFGAFALHAAVNLRNDYLDHLSGLDRIHPQSESKSIQKGWITANQVKFFSNLFIGIGFLFGLPSVLFFPELIFIVFALLVLGFIGIQSYRFGLKYRLWTEVTSYLLLGPFLTIGFQMSIGAHYDLETILIGLITGWFAVFVLHLKNFTQIMINNQAGFFNSITFLGFEKSKYLISFWWLGLIFALNIYHIFYSTLEWQVVFILISLVLTFKVYQAVLRIKSPVNSDFKLMLTNLHRLAVILMSVWVIEFVIFIAVIEFDFV